MRMVRGIMLVFLLIALSYLTYEILYLTYEAGYNLGSETKKYNLGAKAFRNFESEEELKNWLAQDGINRLRWKKEVRECDKFAELLVIHAFEDEYIMYSTAGSIIKFGELATYGYFIPTGNISELKMHAWNYCYVGDSIYWIEPQTDQIFNTERKEL